MKNRRDFLKTGALATAGMMTFPNISFAGVKEFSSNRPGFASRKFTSDIVEDVIKTFKGKTADSELAWMFGNCFPNTLDTTVLSHTVGKKPDTFIITGDIPAMWLRDSTAQVWPYMPLINEDKKLKTLILGLINRQTACILIDPYANAFNKGAEGSHWESDITDMKPELHERKWEIDSLCYAVRLAYNYWKISGDTSAFDKDYKTAMGLILRTFKEQQRKDGVGPYTFMRNTSKYEDNVPLYGAGNPVKPVGLIASIFRPSDDSTVFPFLVPSNYFAVVSLRQMAEISNGIYDDRDFALACNEMADEVDKALKVYARADMGDLGTVIPFEVDGFGNRLMIDDANIPSLLSLPYLDAMDKEEKVYQDTRSYILSENNPFFFKSDIAEGIGGPHIGMNYIWPMSIIMRAMTSDDEKEIAFCLNMLKKTHAGTGFMHESFHKDDPANYTRSWFAWVNTLFGELVWKLYNNKPQIVSA
ncbi:glycoside hydrolase family 125 protein [Aureibacter tunicatorum]|uniref:Metal-independent alpha-mannosidase n=1 Tax=Aureibacter tunicatorum TaxID=866807 RepID=A0AAE3XJN6_9BACT|nr:glycoside hydrolase family 125 protein [Aureibacter tunicatorum]MDR6237248.1 hypothetical protein [Aureibacter tunicatorum]BDD06240.1 hypothetical protein AUTU_37230 [Aureibacter tunicatorum]